MKANTPNDSGKSAISKSPTAAPKKVTSTAALIAKDLKKSIVVGNVKGAVTQRAVRADDDSPND